VDYFIFLLFLGITFCGSARWAHADNLKCSREGPFFSAAMSREQMHKIWQTPLGSSPQCRGMPLKVGQSAVFNLSNEKSATGLEQKYKIQKTGPTSYRMSVNPHFTGKSAALIAQMNKNYFQCAESWGVLQGPQPQQKLEIKIDPSAPVYDVEVKDDPNWRSHSTDFQVNADCNVLLHETLHKTGLVDEYIETEKVTRDQVDWNGLHTTLLSANSPVYNCRNLGNPFSIMYNQGRNFDVYSLGIKKEQLTDYQFEFIGSGGCSAASFTYMECSLAAYDTHAYCPMQDISQKCKNYFKANENVRSFIDQLVDRLSDKNPVTAGAARRVLDGFEDKSQIMQSVAKKTEQLLAQQKIAEASATLQSLMALSDENLLQIPETVLLGGRRAFWDLSSMIDKCKGCTPFNGAPWMNSR
jgi:hypothetical protein